MSGKKPRMRWQEKALALERELAEARTDCAVLRAQLDEKERTVQFYFDLYGQMRDDLSTLTGALTGGNLPGNLP